ncbi:hypothetical protein J7I98_40595 [Streptomyces sp. ISL-98]|uniref:hypothetical protein n=1 Tax=Streptomyces sp. ISL-98 TaxID=2819192 RepID=UPI001BED0327|nr:hypothetical protein [Streptomyces sp. ISL-98]MBT2511937.1 hypothetical protein [Streptomyces sp. ISL-98]
MAAFWDSDAWKAVSAIGTLLGVVLTVTLFVIARRAKGPKRQFLYGMSTPTPILSAPEGVRGDLELRHQGDLLTHPQVMQVNLINRGRDDIPREAFDGEDPIVVDVGARIIKLLGSRSNPETLQAPPARVVGNAIEIGPKLIRGKQSLVYVLLVDGAAPKLKCSIPIVDVSPREIKESDIQELAMSAITPALLATLFRPSPLASVLRQMIFGRRSRD